MARAPKIIPISDLRQNASDTIKRVASSREPVHCPTGESNCCHGKHERV